MRNDLLGALALELNRRFAGRYGRAGGGHVRAAAARPEAGRLAVALYTSHPYQHCPPMPGRNAGGMRRAVLRVEVRGAAIVVTPHSPVLRRLRERRADLASPEKDPAAWVAGVVWEAEGVLHSAVEARLRTPARATHSSRP